MEPSQCVEKAQQWIALNYVSADDCQLSSFVDNPVKLG